MSLNPSKSEQTPEQIAKELELCQMSQRALLRRVKFLENRCRKRMNKINHYKAVIRAFGITL